MTAADVESVQLRRLSIAFFFLLTANYQMSPVRDALGPVFFFRCDPYSLSPV